MSAVTVYNVKVTYEDNAGCFGGWFFHRSQYSVGSTGHDQEIVARLNRMFPSGDGLVPFDRAIITITPADSENV